MVGWLTFFVWRMVGPVQCRMAKGWSNVNKYDQWLARLNSVWPLVD